MSDVIIKKKLYNLPPLLIFITSSENGIRTFMPEGERLHGIKKISNFASDYEYTSHIRWHPVCRSE